jgi:hypothetical protein
VAYWKSTLTLITGRKYPNGEPIPDSLPGKYRTSDRCDTCVAFVPAKENVIYFQGDTVPYCTTWKAIVRPEYVCAVWVPIATVVA